MLWPAAALARGEAAPSAGLTGAQQASPSYSNVASADAGPAGTSGVQAPPLQPEPGAAAASGLAQPGAASTPLPPVLYDIGKLPEPVRSMRQRILDACKSGDLEKLRPLLSSGDKATLLAAGGTEGDPIAYLHTLSGDAGGQEVLAIIEMLLETGYVHLNVGGPDEMYVWPYFAALPLDRLTPPQRVELFKIITAGDYDDMKPYNAYVFYRIGITPEGRWAFFIAGD